ncbi:MAG: B-box zinc finger protein [Dehalococcoidia bacterium]|jgi:hypothetical protein
MAGKGSCYIHPDREATKGCWRCQQLICDECSTVLFGETYCKKCAVEVSKIASDQAGSNLFSRQINSGWLIIGIIVITLIITAVEIFIMTRGG